MARKPNNPRRRVMIDFPTEQAAVEWFREARALGLVPARAGLFVPDALDEMKIPPGGHLLVRAGEGRPSQSAVVAPAPELAADPADD